MDSQPAFDIAVQPSPVLLQAVLKVEQVVARLQELQCTIAGLHLSPRSVKHTRTSRADATTRILDLSGCTSSKAGVAPVERRGSSEDRRSCSKKDRISTKEEPEQTAIPKGAWKHWSSPANQVHDVISEILMASQFAKQVATLVADALQGCPGAQDSDAVVQRPTMRVSREGKRKDIAFPSKTQVHKTMTAKAAAAPPAVHRFKVVFPSNGPAKVGPAQNLARRKDPPKSTSSSPPCKRGASSSATSRVPSPKPASPRPSRAALQTPDKKQKSQKHASSPTAGSRKSGVTNVEYPGVRRHSMGVTEIKGQVKPWRLTPTKGVLFSNPVFTSSPPRAPPARPSPAKIVPSTGRRKSWLTYPFSKARGGAAAPANPLSSSLSKVSFKREAAVRRSGAKPDSAAAAAAASKRAEGPRKTAIFPPSRYIEVVPLDGPRNSSVMTVLDVLNARSPPDVPAIAAAKPARSSRRLAPLDTNAGLGDKPAAAKAEPAKKVQSRVSHSHSMSCSSVESFAAEQRRPVQAAPPRRAAPDSDKENMPVASCAPAVMFLRSLSSGHDLSRTLSRKSSGTSLLQRAKGWMSSQTARQEGRIHDLER